MPVHNLKTRIAGMGNAVCHVQNKIGKVRAGVEIYGVDVFFSSKTMPLILGIF